MIRGFADFIREQGILALAIAVIFGAAVGKVVSSLVNDIIQPILGYIIGSSDGIAKLHAGPVMYGSFIAAVIDFLIIAAVIYIIFKKLGLGVSDKPKDK